MLIGRFTGGLRIGVRTDRHDPFTTLEAWVASAPNVDVEAVTLLDAAVVPATRSAMAMTPAANDRRTSRS